MPELNALTGMTQQVWNSISPAERDRLRDLSGLTPQLVGLEGWRVEVVDEYDHTRRFIVGRSTGWRPCHIEVKTLRSMGGHGADSKYKSVKPLYPTARKALYA